MSYVSGEVHTGQCCVSTSVLLLAVIVTICIK